MDKIGFELDEDVKIGTGMESGMGLSSEFRGNYYIPNLQVDGIFMEIDLKTQHLGTGISQKS